MIAVTASVERAVNKAVRFAVKCHRPCCVAAFDRFSDGVVLYGVWTERDFMRLGHGRVMYLVKPKQGTTK